MNINLSYDDINDIIDALLIVGNIELAAYMKRSLLEELYYEEHHRYPEV